MIESLTSYINEVLESIPVEHSDRPTIISLQSALGQHAQFLAKNPALLFQCLWNDLSSISPQLEAQCNTWRQDKSTLSPKFSWLERMGSETTSLRGLKGIKRLSGHEHVVYRCIFSPDGTKLVSCGEDGRIIIWDVQIGHILMTFEAHRGSITSLSFLPSGDLISVSADCSIKVWNPDTGELKREIPGLNSWTFGALLPLGAHAGAITCVRSFRDGKRIITAAEDGGGLRKDRTARMWDISSGKELSRYSGHDGPVWWVELNHDETVLATASQDKTVRLWSIQSTEQLHVLKHESVVGTLCWHPTKNILWAGLGNGNVIEWDTVAGQQLRLIRCDEHPITCLAINVNGTELYASTLSGKCLNIVLDSLQLRIVTRHNRSAFGVALSSDNKFCAWASADHTVSICDLSQVALIADNQNERPLPPIRDIKFSPNGSCVALIRECTLAIKEIDSDEEYLFVEKHNGFITDMHFLENNLIATSSQDHTVKIWSINTRRLLHTLQHDKIVNCIAYDTSRKLIATGGFENTIRIWNYLNGRIEFELQGHECPVHALCFSANSHILFSASGGEGPRDDNSIRIWNVDERKEVLCLRGHQSPVYAIAVSADGRYLASGSGFGIYSEVSELILWDLLFQTKRTIAMISDEKRIDEIAFSISNPIVMTKHDRHYGELGEGVSSQTGNQYVTRFWDLTENMLYREFDAVIDIARGVARMGDDEWLGVATAGKFYVHHLTTFCDLSADERMSLLVQHPSEATWAGVDGNRLIFYSYRQG